MQGCITADLRSALCSGLMHSAQTGGREVWGESICHTFGHTVPSLPESTLAGDVKTGAHATVPSPSRAFS